MLKFRLHKTILGKFQSLEKFWSLFYCLLLNCITSTTFSLFNSSRPGSLADPTPACVIRLPVAGQGLGNKGGDESLLVILSRT